MDDEKLKFPIDLLPDFIKNYVIEVSEEYQTPIEMAYQSVLGALSTSANGFLGVRTGPEFVEPSILWTMTTAEPGERKGVVRKVFEPVYSLQTRAQKNAEQNRRNYEESVKPEKARLTRILNKALERGDSDEVVIGLQNKIKNLGYEPGFPDYIVDDITVEALAEVLRDNDETLAIVDTEGTYLKVISGIYNRGQANLGFPNKCFDMEPTSSKRKSGGGVSLYGPALTNCLFVQPGIVNKLKNSDFIDSGFIQRFLSIQIEESRLGSRDHRNVKLANPIVTQEWNNRIEAMFTLYRDLKQASNFIGKNSIHVLELSSGAKEIFFDFLQQTELRFRKDGDFNGSFAQWGSKLAGKLARISSFYEAVGAIDLSSVGQRPPNTVSAENMERALGLSEYYVEQAKILWGVVSGTKVIGREELNKNNVIFKWIIKNSKKTHDGQITEPFTAADISRAIRSKISPFQSIKNGLSATDQIQEKLDELVNEYSGQLIEDEVNSGVIRKGGRATKKYRAMVSYAEHLYNKSA